MNIKSEIQHIERSTAEIRRIREELVNEMGAMNMNNEIPSALAKYIATRDKRQKDPLCEKPLLELFLQLLSRKQIEVGGRASCGGAVDPTWVLFASWNEVVRKASKLGFNISVETVKHKNGSPTRSGGFWQSNIYTLVDA